MLTGNALAKEGNIATRPECLVAGRKESGIPAMTYVTDTFTPVSSSSAESMLAPAVTYLRVSTKEQATKGGRDEGFSIPAQRAANHSKAESLGASLIKEFVDAGESAKKADRPALREMIAYVKRHKVAYCIVHKVD